MTTPSDAPQTLVTRGYNDLVGRVAATVGPLVCAECRRLRFPLVAVLAIAYLLVLGPVDYLVVHRWLRRPWAAWITFPLIVLLFGGVGAGAWPIGGKAAGGLRVNQMELVDVDTITRPGARHVLGDALQSAARPIRSAVRCRIAAAARRATPRCCFRAWGLPGAGIGGMQSRRDGFGNRRRRGYRLRGRA